MTPAYHDRFANYVFLIINAEYIDEKGDEILPLGVEFQDFVQCFVSKNDRLPYRQKYSNCSKLILKLQ